MVMQNTYICTNCTGSEKKKVAFTCKSRFCNRCGKVYIESGQKNKQNGY
ncbi:transposase zinc-binding domain-containing protein [Carboxydocella thermautotrophica]